MKSTLAVALGLAAVLFLAPLAAAANTAGREVGTRSVAAVLAGASYDSFPAEMTSVEGFDVQPLDDDERDDEDDDGDDDDSGGSDDDESGSSDDDEGDDDDEDDEDDSDGSDDDEAGDDDEDEGDGDGQGVLPSIQLTLSANSIEQGQSVVASWTVTGFTLDAVAIGSAENVVGKGHVLVLVGGLIREYTAASSISLDGLAVGSHMIRVELRNNDRSPLNSEVYDEEPLAVTESDEPAGPTPAVVGGSPAWLFWLLALLIAIIAAAATILYRRRQRKPGP